MSIYDELKKDHRKVLTLTDKLSHAEKMEKDSRKALIQEIIDELIPHSRAEEAVFYNVLRAVSEDSKVVAHAYQEHVEAEALLRTLKAAEIVDIQWQTGVEKFKSTLSHHIDEEESRVFTAARAALSETDADQIGEAFRQLKAKIPDSNAMKSSLELMINLLPQSVREKAGPLIAKTLTGDAASVQKAS